MHVSQLKVQFHFSSLMELSYYHSVVTLKYRRGCYPFCICMVLPYLFWYFNNMVLCLFVPLFEAKKSRREEAVARSCSAIDSWESFQILPPLCSFILVEEFIAELLACYLLHKVDIIICGYELWNFWNLCSFQVDDVDLMHGKKLKGGVTQPYNSQRFNIYYFVCACSKCFCSGLHQTRIATIW